MSKKLLITLAIVALGVLLSVGGSAATYNGLVRLDQQVQAGVLYPAFGLLLSPLIAAAAMSFSSVSVVGNALRLRKAEV